jgi:amino acid transporter
LQNILGFFKLFALLAIAMTGMFHVIGVPGFALQAGVDVPRNFERDTFWEGSGIGANAFVTGMTNVIWYARFLCVEAHQVWSSLLLWIHRSFIGYSNANYALSEVRDPVGTIKRAAPAAMISVTAVYAFVNIAYFSVVSKEDILGSGQIAA